MPRDRSFRPTKAIVRESIFNILGQQVVGSKWLDACAGSGAVGFEAESRGASHVVCVDRHTEWLMKNKSHLSAKADVVRRDICEYVAHCTDTFDVIFFDPIWDDADVYRCVIDDILARSMLAQGGHLIVEHSQAVQPFDANLVIRRYKYGRSILSVYHHPKR